MRCVKNPPLQVSAVCFIGGKWLPSCLLFTRNMFIMLFTVVVLRNFPSFRK